jgi:hypothetical protein
MWFRRMTGAVIGLLILALGIFLSIDELRGDEPARWWFPAYALAPGVIVLAITWLTWSSPRNDRAE